MLRLNEKGIDIIQPSVGGFSHEGSRPALEDTTVFHLPLNDGVPHNAHAVCVCNPNGTFEETAFLHPGGAGHFAVAIKGEPSCEYGIVYILSARVDNGHSRPGGVTLNNGAVPNGHAENICDGVVCRGCAFKWNPQIAGARLGHISPLVNIEMTFAKFTTFA